MNGRINSVWTGVLCILGAGLQVLPAIAHGRIWEVSVDQTNFNPIRGGQVTLQFQADSPTAPEVLVYDPDGGLVRVLKPTRLRGVDAYRVDWDGRDADDRVVPDEAYTFNVVATDDDYYDPTTVSGGVVGDITAVQFQHDAISYRLGQPSRVLIRIGIRAGPMLRTLVDWKPRVGGVIREPWNGRDHDDLVDLRGIKGFKALVTYVTLPDATVIAYGNGDETYRGYKFGRGKDRPVRPERPRLAKAGERLRPVGLVPPAWSRAPRVTLSFVGDDVTVDERGVALVRDSVRTRIDVEPNDRPALEGDQFEVIMFTDNELLAEAERGYLPLTWRWDLKHLPPGEHVLTVNISSFGGQVGVTSRRIRRIE